MIRAEQNNALTGSANRLEKSEGALIREVADGPLVSEQEADALWDAMIARWASNPVRNASRTWTRSELYDDRVELRKK